MSLNINDRAATAPMAMNDAVPSRIKTAVLGVTDNIHSVRGLACLLIVAFHVIGDDAGEGLHLPDNSGWHYAMKSLLFLRLPLFTVISGYFYGGGRVTRPDFVRFWQKKFRRIALPFLCVTIVVWLLHRHVYGEPKSLLHAIVYGYEQLWFLEALLVIFAAMSVWDMLFRPGSGALVLAAVAMIMIAQCSTGIVELLSLSDAIRLAPYFLFGILMRERGEALRDPELGPKLGLYALGIVAIVLAGQQFGMNGWGNEISRTQMPAVLAGMAGAAFLFQRLPRNAVLEAIGGYSYTIFLWHVVVGAAARLVLLRLGVASTPVLFSLIVIAAVGGPMLLLHALRWTPLLSMALTGERGPPRNRRLFRPGTAEALAVAAPLHAPGQ